MRAGVKRREWVVANDSPAADEICIAGWEFGGSGPIALLAHANGMCGALWDLVAAGLTDRFRVFAIDARGHGDSAHLSVPEDYAWDYFAHDLHRVAEQLLIEYQEPRIELGLGSSFGGILTAAAEAEKSGLYGRIVMLDPPVHRTAEIYDRLDLPHPEEGFTSHREAITKQTLARRWIWPDRETAAAAWRYKAAVRRLA